MYSNSTKRHDNGTLVRRVSVVVFIVFSFCWLYFFQADFLAVTNHTLATTPNASALENTRILVALFLTLVLLLILLGARAVAPLKNGLFALTFFPSFWALTLLGNLQQLLASARAAIVWGIASVVLLALWGLVSRFFSRLSRYETNTRTMWVNLLLLSVMMGGVAALTNTQAVYHYRARMETLLLEQQPAEALQVGLKSLETDASLTMLRAYSLACCQQPNPDGQSSTLLAERLFQYPVGGNGADLVPSTADSHSRTLRYPVDSIYRRLGALPRRRQTTAQYLETLERHHQATAVVRDYVLCGLLVDRRLDDFVRLLPRYYTVNDSVTLPRHYREALTLYRHLRAQPRLVYHHAVTEEDYRNLQELESQYGDPRERKIRVLENYFGSYWYYYEYMK